MIRFTLSCDQGHRFDSWFASSEAFDRLSTAGHVTCAVCGSTDVSKALMAPKVHTDDAPLSSPKTAAEQAVTELRKKVEREADYVGDQFATEARAIHDGTSPERAIWGQTTPTEAKKLVQDGVPVAPLPFAPKRKRTDADFDTGGNRGIGARSPRRQQRPGHTALPPRGTAAPG